MMKRVSDNRQAIVSQGNTLYDIIQDRSFNEVQESDRACCSDFMTELRTIREFCASKGLDIGAALLLLRNQFKLDWRTIPLDKFPEIREWFKNNWFRQFQILYPATHAFQMTVTDSPHGVGETYREQFNRLNVTQSKHPVSFIFD